MQDLNKKDRFEATARRRIRIGQLRIGMFVEEIEIDRKPTHHTPFIIKGPSDLRKLMASKAISVVIDMSKGLDISGPSDPEQFERDLYSRFSVRDISAARSTIAIAAPMINEMLSSARSSSLDMRCASAAVSQLMSSASGNAAAIIGLARLKITDETTFLHSLSVSVLMVTLCRVLGMAEEDVREVGIGGLLHDIGKMRIPSQVLNKVESLTTEEFSVIKSHAELGYNMLREVDDISTNTLDICRYHHEKFDGTGYPLGLVGDNIPFLARLAAICDVYDALTTIRPYKTAWTQGQAVDWMLTSTGHFDSALLKTFVSRMVLSGV